MRLRLNVEELEILLGMIGNLDWSGHFEGGESPEADEKDYAIAKRMQEKLEARYWYLKNKRA